MHRNANESATTRMEVAAATGKQDFTPPHNNPEVSIPGVHLTAQKNYTRNKF